MHLGYCVLYGCQGSIGACLMSSNKEYMVSIISVLAYVNLVWVELGLNLTTGSHPGQPSRAVVGYLVCDDLCRCGRT